MKLELTTTKTIEPQYLKVEAGVRYWDDAEVNGCIICEDGEGTPLRDGDAWIPTIRLCDGVILNWPQGTVAKFHYKICDGGNYYLLDGDFQTLAKRENNYVPGCLAVGDSGYGDYIIMKVDSEGKIIGWSANLDEYEWDLA